MHLGEGAIDFQNPLFQPVVDPTRCPPLPSCQSVGSDPFRGVAPPQFPAPPGGLLDGGSAGDGYPCYSCGTSVCFYICLLEVKRKSN